MKPNFLDASTWFQKGQDELKEQLKKTPKYKKAKNVIFFLGDGAGVSTLTAARWLKGQRMGKRGEEHIMEWEKFPYSSIIKV